MNEINNILQGSDAPLPTGMKRYETSLRGVPLTAFSPSLKKLMSSRSPELASDKSSDRLSKAGTPSKVNKDEAVSKKEPEINILNDSLVDHSSATSMYSLHSKISSNMRVRVTPDLPKKDPNHQIRDARRLTDAGDHKEMQTGIILSKKT